MRLGDFINLNPKIKLTKGIPYAFVEMKDLEPSIRSVFSNCNKEFSGSGSRFECGDTLLARITPCLENGKTSQFNGCSSPAWGSTEFIVLRGIPNKSDNAFIYYFSRSPEFRSYAIQNMVGSSGRQRVPNDVVKDFECEFPPLRDQKAIAHILGTLDDKIEFNQKMNQTLEDIAKAIFKSWFVDFDPVRAKAEGRPTGLAPEISDLFPDELVDSEIGEIPRGWEVANLSDIADVTMGQSPPGSTYNDNEVGLPFYQGSTDFGFRFPSIRKFCSEPNRLAEKDDVLLSVRAPVGDLNRALNQCCIGRGLASIRSKSGFSSWIFYRCSFLKEYFDTFNSEGTVFGSVNRTDLRGIKTPVANSEILNCFEDVVSPMDKSIRSRTDEIRVLSELRDTLLPKLISGELRIPDAEKFLEGAGI